MTSVDDVLPDYEWSERHAIELPCGPERALEAIWELPVGADPIVRVLFRLRGLSSNRPIGRALTGLGFHVIARSETEVVLAAAGTPWRPRGGLRPVDDTGPGTVRVAVDFRATAIEDGSRLSTETRIAPVDAAARQAFGRYWRVVGPFSALIRRRWLAAARRSVS